MIKPLPEIKIATHYRGMVYGIYAMKSEHRKNLLLICIYLLYIFITELHCICLSQNNEFIIFFLLNLYFFKQSFF